MHQLTHSKRLTHHRDITDVQHITFHGIQRWDDTLINNVLSRQTKGEHPCYEQSDSVPHWVLLMLQRDQAGDGKVFRFFLSRSPKGCNGHLSPRAVSCVLMQDSVLYSLLYSMNKISQRHCEMECISMTAVSRWHPSKEMLVLHRA